MKKIFVWALMLAMVAGAATITRSDAYQMITDSLLAGDLDGRSILAMNRLVSGSDRGFGYARANLPCPIHIVFLPGGRPFYG